MFWTRLAIVVVLLLILWMLIKCHRKDPPMFAVEGYNGVQPAPGSIVQLQPGQLPPPPSPDYDPTQGPPVIYTGGGFPGPTRPRPRPTKPSPPQPPPGSHITRSLSLEDEDNGFPDPPPKPPGYYPDTSLDDDFPGPPPLPPGHYPDDTQEDDFPGPPPPQPPPGHYPDPPTRR